MDNCLQNDEKIPISRLLIYGVFDILLNDNDFQLNQLGVSLNEENFI